ncbi:hypothetical protein K438DRAFT_1794395 [Mycena galopus ATCC 62051]|nr:hypothetical protein K438DRAFT_1794395 [Mycena galopus ATCC 62051]
MAVTFLCVENGGANEHQKTHRFERGDPASWVLLSGHGWVWDPVLRKGLRLYPGSEEGAGESSKIQVKEEVENQTHGGVFGPRAENRSQAENEDDPECPDILGVDLNWSLAAMSAREWLGDVYSSCRYSDNLTTSNDHNLAVNEDICEKKQNPAGRGLERSSLWARDIGF